MSWKLAPALDVLFKEINARWPDRDRSSDGTIGDTSHAARKSEHNPNRDPSDDVPDGMVTAADIDITGIDKATVLARLIKADRVWYVIHDRKIYSRTHGWKALTYTGENPHTGHIHVSLVQSAKACRDITPWGIKAVKPRTETQLQRVTRIAHQRKVRIQKLLAKLRRR